MPRNLPSPMITAVTAKDAVLCFLLDLQLRSGIEYVWSGYGSVVWNGHTYKGVGQLGAIGEIKESSDVKAPGTVIALSGIDATLLAESLADIQQGAPAVAWLGSFSAGAVVSAYKLFAGTVDKPDIALGTDTATIQIALETRMANLQRPTNRRYTQADQRYYYATDIGFAWVETQNDIALIWG